MKPMALATALCFVLTGCREYRKNPWDGFSGKVSCHRPPTALQFIRPSGKDSLWMDGLERSLTRRPSIIDSLASSCQPSSVGAGEGWRLMGAFIDGSGMRHIVYFNRYQNDRIMAGRKLHLCFDGDRNLKEIFVYEVPLE